MKYFLSPLEKQRERYESVVCVPSLNENILAQNSRRRRRIGAKLLRQPVAKYSELRPRAKLGVFLRAVASRKCHEVNPSVTIIAQSPREIQGSISPSFRSGAAIVFGRTD